MKYLMLSMLNLFILGKVSGHEYEVDRHLTQESHKILSAYEILVNHFGDEATVASRQSLCRQDICAINFVTDNENLGFYVRMISDLGLYAEGAPVLGFGVHPNGATLASGIPEVRMPERARPLSVERLHVIGGRTAKALNVLGWSGFKGLDSWTSECRAVKEALTCRLNFEGEHESFGVMLQGFINTREDDLIFVSAFTTNPSDR